MRAELVQQYATILENIEEQSGILAAEALSVERHVQYPISWSDVFASDPQRSSGMDGGRSGAGTLYRHGQGGLGCFERNETGTVREGFGAKLVRRRGSATIQSDLAARTKTEACSGGSPHVCLFLVTAPPPCRYAPTRK